MLIGTLRLLVAYLRLAAAKIYMYRLDSLFLFFRWLASMALIIVFWRIMFKHVENIGGWGFYELAMLTASCYYSWGIFVVFWGMYVISDKIVEGDLDKHFSKPVIPLVGMIAEEFEFLALAEVVSGAVAMFAIYCFSPERASPAMFVIGMALLTLGTMVFLLIHGTVSFLGFMLGKTGDLNRFLDSFDEVQRYPVDIFPPVIRRFLTFGVPVAVYSSLPVSLMYGRTALDLNIVLLYLVLPLAWFLIFCAAWNHFSKYYTSSGG